MHICADIVTTKENVCPFYQQKPAKIGAIPLKEVGYLFNLFECTS